MKNRWHLLSLNQKLGVVAFLLGAVAVFGTPQTGPVSRVDGRELARIVETGASRVSPGELAAWILEGRADYRLLDLRDEAAIAAYTIPTAEPVRVTELLHHDLARNEKIVLYGEDETQAAKAWFVMRSQGFRSVSILQGGLAGWKNEVLFPVSPGPDADEATRLAFDRRMRVSTFFGGRPRAAMEGGAPMVSLDVPDMAMPEVVAPTGGGGGTKAASRRKKAREGC